MIYIITGFFIGSLLIGTLLIGKLAERFGRANVLRWTTALTTLGEFLILAAGDAWYFMVILVFITIMLPGMFMMPIVYLTEVTAFRSRNMSLMVLICMCTTGYLPAYFLMYYFYSWRPIVLGSMGCGFFSFLFSWLLVESPRYLAVIMARYTKARSAFEYIALTNKKPMFEVQLQGEILNEYSETIRKRQGLDMSGLGMDASALPDAYELRDNEHEESNRDAIAPFEYLGGAANAVDRESDLDRGHKYNYMDLFREDLRKIALIMTLIWIIQGAVIYSYMHSGYILEDPYMNVVIHVILSVSGFFICGITSLFVRTKKIMMWLAVLAGIFTLAEGIMLLIGKNSQEVYALGVVSISAFYYILVIYTVEIFPTPARCIGLGFLNFFGILGIIGGYAIVFYVKEGLTAAGAALILMPILLLKMPETGGAPLNDFSVWTPL